MRKQRVLTDDEIEESIRFAKGCLAAEVGERPPDPELEQWVREMLRGERTGDEVTALITARILSDDWEPRDTRPIESGYYESE